MSNKIEELTEKPKEEIEETYTCLRILGRENSWIIDSEASAHMTYRKDFFSNLDTSKKSKICIADSTYLKVEGIGDGFITYELQGTVKKVLLKRVLYAIWTTTRPDICIDVNILCRRTSNSRKCDWEAAKRVISYLSSTQNIRMKFTPGSVDQILCYSESDWAGDLKDRKSTSGFVMKLGNNAIDWNSRKQTSVEFIAAETAANEMLWLIQLFKGIGIFIQTPVTILEDNQSCIKIIGKENCNARTKHIHVKYNIIKDLQSKGLCNVFYCESKDMVADMFTKTLLNNSKN